MATAFAWVIERGSGSDLRYYAPTAPGEWTKDHLKACRFARKEDAESVQFLCVIRGHADEDATRVCEHGWGGLMTRDQKDAIYAAYLGICVLTTMCRKEGLTLGESRGKELLIELGNAFPFIPEKVGMASLRVGDADAHA